jgi:hypothetical protein
MELHWREEPVQKGYPPEEQLYDPSGKVCGLLVTWATGWYEAWPESDLASRRFSRLEEAKEWLEHCALAQLRHGDYLPDILVELLESEAEDVSEPVDEDEEQE